MSASPNSKFQGHPQKKIAKDDTKISAADVEPIVPINILPSEALVFTIDVPKNALGWKKENAVFKKFVEDNGYITAYSNGKYHDVKQSIVMELFNEILGAGYFEDYTIKKVESLNPDTHEVEESCIVERNKIERDKMFNPYSQSFSFSKKDLSAEGKRCHTSLSNWISNKASYDNKVMKKSTERKGMLRSDPDMKTEAKNNSKKRIQEGIVSTNEGKKPKISRKDVEKFFSKRTTTEKQNLQIKEDEKKITIEEEKPKSNRLSTSDKEDEIDARPKEVIPENQDTTSLEVKDDVNKGISTPETKEDEKGIVKTNEKPKSTILHSINKEDEEHKEHERMNHSFFCMHGGIYTPSFRVPPSKANEKDFIKHLSAKKNLFFREIQCDEFAFKSSSLLGEHFTTINESCIERIKGTSKDAEKNYAGAEAIDMFLIINERYVLR